MADPAKERWQELCELASTEKDSTKLLELVTEINQLLEKKTKLRPEDTAASNT
jgi:hypothetical protein